MKQVAAWRTATLVRLCRESGALRMAGIATGFVVLEDVGRPVRLEGPTREQLLTAYAAVSG
jgi:hypothetical protein